MKPFTAWLDARRLTTRRAGSASQRFASQRLDRYVRSHLVELTMSAVLILVISVGTWLLLASRPGFQGIAAGLVAGVGFAFIYHWTVVSSGAASGTMGKAAEEWTDSELRRLRRKGWRHVNHLVIKPEFGDIDHVAVGPDGVIVVETKWRSHEEDVDHLSTWISGTLEQARRNRKVVTQFLNWQRRDPMLVQALVVLWGPGITHDSGEAILRSDINVIAGQHLRDELAHLSNERLSPGEVDEIYAKLTKRIDVRDEWERSHLPIPAATMQERANQWVRSAVAGWTGLFIALSTFGLGWWSLPALLFLIAVSFVARRTEQIRLEASAFLTGVMTVLPLILFAALWSAIR